MDKLKPNITSFIVLLYFSSLIAWQFDYGGFSKLFIPLFLILYVFFFKNTPSLCLVILLILITFITLSSLFQNQEIKIWLFNITATCFNFCFALFLQKTRFNEKWFKWYIFMLFFIMLFFTITSNNSRAIFYKIGVNYTSWLLLIIVNLYFIILFKKNMPIPIWPVLGAFLFSLLAGGRSGIIANGLLLLGVIVIPIKKRCFINYTLLLTSFIVVVLLFIYLFPTHVQHSLQRFSGEKLGEDPRIEIINAYLNELEGFKHFLFGYSDQGSDVIQMYNGNLHNSFLNLHRNFGLGFFLIVIMIIYSMFYYLRENRMYFFMFASTLLRISTDNIAFIGYCDFILFFFILLPIISVFCKRRIPKKDFEKPLKKS